MTSDASPPRYRDMAAFDERADPAPGMIKVAAATA
jgi:hypothetical protein